MSILDAPFIQTRTMSLRHAFHSGVEAIVSNNLSNGLTFRAAHAFKAKPLMARILFYNNLTTPITFLKVGAASMATPQSSLSPATSIEWTQGGSVTLPAANGVNNPSAAYSPWMNVFAVPSTSNPGTWFVTVFAYLDPSFTTYSCNNYDVSWMETTDPATGGYFAQRNQAGDNATVPGNFSSTTVQPRGPIAGIEILSDVGSVLLMDVGDSIMAGAGQTYLGKTDVYRAACAVNALNGTIVSHMRCGWGGQNSATYGARALYMLPIIQPDVLVLTTGTPNDGTPSLTGQVGNRSVISQILALCKAQGTSVILRGWAPHSVVADNWPQGTLTNTPTGTVSGDVYRQDQNFRSAAMDGIGNIIYTPGISVLGDGNKPERYLPQYTTDLNHPNDAGYQLASVNMQAAISRMILKFK